MSFNALETCEVVMPDFLPFKSDASEAPAYWFLDILWIVHATAEQTAGRYTLIEQYMPQGSGPPPHVHPIDEIFYVIAGEMTAHVGEKTLVIGAGGTGNIPKNAVHSFRVTSVEICRVLNFYNPAGFEKVLMSCAELATARELPPPGRTDMHSTKLVQFYNNYWTADAESPWARAGWGSLTRI